MSDTQPLIERAKELRDLCRDRNRRVWFCSSGLMERTEPVLTGLITDLVKRTEKIVELEEDVERVRMINRDLEAQVAGLKRRVADLQSHCKIADDSLSTCRTLSTKLSESISAARTETFNAVRMPITEASE